MASLIKQMLAHSPADRPSARDLLRSDLLPPTVADEAVSDLLRSLPDAPDMLERVVDAIFSLPGGIAQGPQVQEEPGGPANVQVCDCAYVRTDYTMQICSSGTSDTKQLMLCEDVTLKTADVMSVSGCRLTFVSMYEIRLQVCFLCTAP